MTMTMVQLSSIAMWSPTLLSYLKVPTVYAKVGGGYNCEKMLFILACGKFVASLMSHFSILNLMPMLDFSCYHYGYSFYNFHCKRDNECK